MKSADSKRSASSTLATLSSTASLKALSKPLGLEQFRRFPARLISLQLKVVDLIQMVSRQSFLPLVIPRSATDSLTSKVKSTGKESLQWGLAAGMYSGLTYGLREARGAHDWKNSAVAGAITGMALALTTDDVSHEQVVQCAITGAAISTAANLLTAGIF
ncbi:outer envelope pore protein 16-2, chloroplastic isoform X2 [Manihot esculenta]|uniref:outer envelope pore protein 16-2, chloroplastic isoform X2 n=1 Tax=Manihot esculenta TaxID=3983 RepID=UPI001CC82C57|nr:outer envelope pore protein 16-2, chloroplastic isoform X2 [Manihot esculenta]